MARREALLHRRTLVRLAAVGVGVALGFGVWLALPEGGERATAPPLWGPNSSGWQPIGRAEGTLAIFPVRDAAECEQARAQLAEQRESVLGQNARNLQELEKSSAASDFPASELQGLREYYRLERAWWETEEAKARAWLDAGCPDDGIRGAMRAAPDGQAMDYRLLEFESFGDWLVAHWSSLPEWFREWLRASPMGAPPGVESGE
ncbi:MAG: hypothetical protein RMK15_02420 [Chloroflexota bacterium]|nr:hypothetical protein [Dehalococcoidia bacterium]MDW8046119.1 hypothetical protein [Chloroflexota bacterium]